MCHGSASHHCSCTPSQPGVAVNGGGAANKSSRRSLEANLSAANLLRTSSLEWVPLLWSTQRTPTTVPTECQRASLRLTFSCTSMSRTHFTSSQRVCLISSPSDVIAAVPCAPHQRRICLCMVQTRTKHPGSATNAHTQFLTHGSEHLQVAGADHAYGAYRYDSQSPVCRSLPPRGTAISLHDNLAGVRNLVQQIETWGTPRVHQLNTYQGKVYQVEDKSPCGFCL